MSGNSFKFKNSDLEKILSLKVKGFTSRSSVVKRSLDQIPQISKSLNLSLEDAINLVVENPFMLEYDFKGRFDRIVEVYGEENKNNLAKIIGGYQTPRGKHRKGDARFITYSHQRTLEKLYRVGSKFLGLDEETIKRAVMKHPKLVSYSNKRNLASIDVLRSLYLEGYELDFDTCCTYLSRSPHVSGKRHSKLSRDLNEVGSKSRLYEELRRKLPLRESSRIDDLMCV